MQPQSLYISAAQPPNPSSPVKHLSLLVNPTVHRGFSPIESSGCRAMGIRVPAVVRVKQMLRQSSCSEEQHLRSSLAATTPTAKKGHFAVYVDGAGREMKRFVVPIAYLQHPLFQSLLRSAEEEYGFDYAGGVLRVPCDEDAFERLTSQINY